MNPPHAFKLTLLALMLGNSALATAQMASSSESDKLPSYMNVPPDALAHPEQFGIDDFGRTSALAVQAANATGDVPTAPNAAPTAGPLPTQFANGNFNSVAVPGWKGYTHGDDFFLPNIYGPNFATNRGLPAPSGAPVMHGDAFNATQTPKCSKYGWLWQDLRVPPGSVLKFNWNEAYSGATSFGEGTLTVTIRDANDDSLLWSVTRPNSQSVYGGKYSEIDLSRYAGLDLRFRFESKPKPVIYPIALCNNTTWFDNVALEQRPIAYRNVLPTAGQWYNPQRAGSGWDLRRAPNGQYFAVWYTFQNGTPVWYTLDLASVTNGTFETQIRRFQRVGTSSQQNVVGRARLQMLSTTTAMMSFDFFDTANNASGWDNTEWFQLLMAGGGNPMNGQWFSNDPADPNWGIATLVIPNNQMFNTQYFYDASGNPTWTFATGNFFNGGTLPATRVVGGLCPNCSGTVREVQHVTVGNFTLGYPDPSYNTMNAAFTVGDWNRPARTYYKLSN